MPHRKPAKPHVTVKQRQTGLEGVVPITKFLINIAMLDSTPIFSAHTQQLIPIPTSLVQRQDFFLHSIRTSDAVETWANAFVTIQKMAKCDSTRHSAKVEMNHKGDAKLDLVDSPLLPPKRPEKSNKPTLVLDLDSTLFYASDKQLNTPLGYLDLGQDSFYRYLYLRPYALDFLSWAANVFEVVIWTAGLESYAQPRLEVTGIDRYIDAVLFRDACDTINGCLVKNLAKLGRSLSDMIIVDDNPVSYALNVELAYPIPAFTGEDDDVELLCLVPILRKALELSSLKRGIYRAIFSGSSMHRALETLGQYTYLSDF